MTRTKKVKNPNYKGNPNIVKYGFKTDRPESCTAQISLRIPPSVKNKLGNVDGWHEEVRKLLVELTDKIPA